MWTQKQLNSTLAIDSPFQTFVVGLFVEFIDLALPLLSPEMLSSTRIFLYNAHLALFVRMDDTITRTNETVSIKLELALEVRALPSLFTDQTTESLQNGNECEHEELHFRRGSPLACRVMDIACFSLYHVCTYSNKGIPLWTVVMVSKLSTWLSLGGVHALVHMYLECSWTAI